MPGWGWDSDPLDPRERYSSEMSQLESNRGFYRATEPITWADYLAREGWKLDTPGRSGPIRTHQLYPQDTAGYWKGKGRFLTQEDQEEIAARLWAANKAEAERSRRFR